MRKKGSLKNWEMTCNLYCYIKTYIEQESLPPTQREMADACYISTGTVMRHLDRLITKGYIEIMEGRSRGVKLTRKTMDCDDCANADK